MKAHASIELSVEERASLERARGVLLLDQDEADRWAMETLREGIRRLVAASAARPSKRGAVLAFPRRENP